jgi:hypothetical protein
MPDKYTVQGFKQDSELMAKNFYVVWNEDENPTVLARITAKDGTGTLAKRGEGNWLKRADITSIVRNVFDLSSATPDTVVLGPTTLSLTTVVLDTPDNSGDIWTVDMVGYNFIDTVPLTPFATGGNRYSVEYIVTLTGGTVFHALYSGPTKAIRSS